MFQLDASFLDYFNFFLGDFEGYRLGRSFLLVFLFFVNLVVKTCDIFRNFFDWFFYFFGFTILLKKFNLDCLYETKKLQGF